MTETLMTDEVIIVKGEPHYLWPHLFDGGNSSRCGKCRYFTPEEKSKDVRFQTGQCISEASKADRTHIFTRKTADIHSCRWWFPVESPNYFG